MRTCFAAVALVATTAMTSLAAAQTTAPAPAPGATTTTTVATSGQWRTSKLVGLNVYNEQNEKLGDISEVLVDTAGKVTGIVIGVGGFLGLGQRDIMVPLDQLRFVNEPMRTTTSTTTTPAPSPSTTGTATTTTVATERRWYPDHAIMAGATKDSVKNMTEFKYN